MTFIELFPPCFIYDSESLRVHECVCVCLVCTMFLVVGVKGDITSFLFLFFSVVGSWYETASRYNSKSCQMHWFNIPSLKGDSSKNGVLFDIFIKFFAHKLSFEKLSRLKNFVRAQRIC